MTSESQETPVDDDAAAAALQEHPIAGRIQRIEHESVQRIVAGQAVTDLPTAVKELVDNALDAGSHSINIRLFEKGLEILEVSDDGIGVPAHSRKYLATPHATSKIKKFEDIYHTGESSDEDTDSDDEDEENDDDEEELPSSSLTTMGFRGEALFCLANLSEDLIVATRTADEAVAQKMHFRRDGSLIESSVEPTPRKVGTTVAVVKLFNAVPVRRKDLENRMKTQRAKLMDMMEGYAAFSVGVKFNLMDVNRDKKGNPEEKTLLATTGNNRNIQETVSSIYGANFLANMAKISVDLSTIVGRKGDSSSTTTAVANAGKSKTRHKYKMHGLISKAGTPKIRGVRQAQLFSINRRPVDLPKVARLINDTWRSFGSAGGTQQAQLPSCVLQFTLPNNAFDINLSPDKRQVIFTHEKEIYDAIQTGIIDLWKNNTEGQFQASQTTSVNFSAEAISAANNSFHSSYGASSHSPGGRRKSLFGTEVYSDDDSNYSYYDDDDDDPIDTSGYVASRRFAFTDDPKLASQKEAENKLRREQFEAEAAKKAVEGAKIKDDEEKKTAETPDGNKSGYGSESGSNDKEGKDGRGQTTDESKKTPSSGVTKSITPSPGQNSNMKSPQVIASQQGEAESEKSFQEEDVEKQKPLGSSRVNARLWSEKTQWRDALTKFNAPGTSPMKGPLDELKAQEMKRHSDQIESFRRSHPETCKKRKTFGLEQFGFSAVKRVSNAAESSENIDSNSKSSLSDRTTNGSQDQDSQKQNSENTGPPTHSRHQRTVSLPKNNSSDPQVFEEAKNSGGNPNVDAAVGECKDPKKEEDNKISYTPTTIQWTSLKDTDNVVAASIRERIAMHERKSGLRNANFPDFKLESLENSLDAEKAFDYSRGSIISLTREDFKSMKVHGQFNLGFILATTKEGNLWILDQHACDEKINFEKLVKETVIHEQRLIAPMPLELSPSEETCVLDHMDIFEKNGFRFSYDPSKPVRHRLALTALPHSGARDGRKAVQFGKEDVAALCEILGADDCTSSYGERSQGGTGVDGSGKFGNNAVRRYATGANHWGNEKDSSEKIIARLPKAIAMFASRACRGSIMIGTALSDKEMDRIVKKLSDIEHPWNCPHGRPTMRHVGNLTAILEKDEKIAAEHVASPTITMLSQEETEV